MLSSLELSLSDAFFESMSGITTTGSTVIPDLDITPKSILIWRAIMQWLGGIGIIVMATTVLPLLKVGGMQLFRTDASGTEKILPKTIEVATTIISIYVILTLSCASIYWIQGMNAFDSVAHSFTTLATGGFSTHNESIGFFKNPGIEITATLFIILGSIPFIAYLKFIKGNKKIFFEDVQIKGFVYLILISILVMFAYLFINNNNHSFFDKNISLVDWLRQWANNDEEREELFIRSFLGRMLFGGDEALKSCNVLSGGEKVRCMLSKIMMGKPNVLLIDEPTNHLDLESITAFNNSLINFQGTVLLSSNDRAFAESVSNRIIEITPNGVIDSYLPFSEYINDDKVLAAREKLYN